MKKIYYLLGLTLLSPVLLCAQQNETVECATESLMEIYFKDNPQAKKEYDAFNLELAKQTKNGELKRQLKSKTQQQQFYEIPIVVHVLSKGDAIGTANNPDDKQIIDWINYTNDVFAGKAENVLNDTNGGAIIPVKFVFAKIDPKGNTTNGIDRIDLSANEQFVKFGLNGSAGYDGLHDKEVIIANGWESTKYYNIYVAHKIASGTVVANGYANYPTGDLSNDRSVMLASVSKVGQQTMAHEFGHGLGLRHTHEGFTAGEATLARDADGKYTRDANGDYAINVTKPAVCPTNNDCTKEGDLVCDTEPSLSLYDPTINLYRCLSNGINQCTGNVYAGVEKNIMAYTYCFRDRFTPGQVDRALAHLFRYRESLINSPVLANQVSDNNITLTPASCVPTDIENNNNYVIGTVNVKFNEINNWTTPYNNFEKNFYKDYTGTYLLAKTTTNIPYNSPTKLSIRTSDSTNKTALNVYIDYNNDGVFSETDELVLSKSGILQNELTTADITPPSNAAFNKPLRMRVITDYNGTIITSCKNPRYGDVEDYAVTIINNNLSINDLDSKKINILTKESTVLISANDIISSISITDITGRLIFQGNNINKKEFSKRLNTKNQVYIVIVSLQNGEKISKKIIL